MEQMINTGAKTHLTMPFQDAESGFMRDHGGKIFFLCTHGRQTMPFPVFRDGTISNQADLDMLLILAGKKVKIVHPKDLGITEIKWAN